MTHIIKNTRIYTPKNIDMEKICIFMHGSGGFIPSNMWYVKKILQNGYTVIAPDHTKYCKKCLGYHSTYKNIQRKNSKLPKLYRHIVSLRNKEVNTWMKLLKNTVNKQIVLCGISEGAIPVSRYEDTENKVKKRIIISYSPENNYFDPQKDPLKNGEIHNLIGDKDEYFGKINSVASSLNKNLTGHAKCSKKPRCKVYIFKNSTHDLTLNNKSRLSHIFKTIL